MEAEGKYVIEITDEKTGEKIEKTFHFVKPDPPGYKEPIAIPIMIPQDKRKQFYTIGDIIKIAEIIFLFSSKPQKSASKSIEDASSKVRSKTSGKYDSIRKYVSKQLKGKEDKKDSSMDRKARLYSHATVEEFFQTYENQLYFLDIGISQNEKLIQAMEKEEKNLTQQISETTVRESKGLRERLNSIKQKKADALSKLEKVKAKREPLTGNKQEELQKKFQAIITKTLDEFASNSSIDFLVNKYKEKFLIQFLIESLIEVNEELLIHDLEQMQNSKHWPGIEDGPADVDVVQAPTIIQMDDFHNYYKGKVDLAKIFEASLTALQKSKSGS